MAAECQNSGIHHFTFIMKNHKNAIFPQRPPTRRQVLCSLVEKRFYALGIYSSNVLCLPDFLGIGAQKAGTSWLYENLQQHPEVYLPKPKELHYFDWNFHTSLRSYANRFKPGSQKVKGEITPGYSIIPVECIRFIRTIMPDVKLIFIMRNPIERAWSQALMNLVKLPNKKFEEVDESEFYAHFKAQRSVQRGDYQTILKNWLHIFPHGHLYIGFFEDILHCPQRLLKDVFRHIGVSSDVDWDTFPYRQIIYKGSDIPLPQKYREFLEEMYCQEIELLHERFGAPVASWRCK